MAAPSSLAMSIWGCTASIDRSRSGSSLHSNKVYGNRSLRYVLCATKGGGGGRKKMSDQKVQPKLESQAEGDEESVEVAHGHSAAKQRIEEELQKQRVLEQQMIGQKRKQKEIEARAKELAEARRKLKEEQERAAKIKEEEDLRRAELEAALERNRIAAEKKRLADIAAERIMKEEARKRDVLKAAEQSSLLGKKVFYVPEEVEAGGEVEIYFNRGITALANEDDLQIMGAFNEWEWQPFTSRLRKCELLPGDWWSGKVLVPQEAYVLNFVFFNGNDVYENNEAKDFFIPVVGGMDVEEFEDFMVQEKRKEAEKIALEQAARERVANEARKLAEQRAAEEADRAEAMRIVAERREKALLVLQKAVKCVDGLWEFVPPDFSGGRAVSLLYNASFRPLASSSDIWIHGGYNNWQEAVSVSKKLSRTSSAKVGKWWSAEVFVPNDAFVLDWVFADGPPDGATVYDNNDYQDFHAIVPECRVSEDSYWDEVEQNVYAAIREERKKKEEAAKKKAEYKMKMKEEMKRRTRMAFLKSQSLTIYTEPEVLTAGETASVFYNPLNTVLSEMPEVWLRHSFNRWTHRKGPFPPIKMSPLGQNSHLKASVKIPLDSYVMDAVFSERGDEEGGAYDNKGGFDYHIPVIGSIVKEPPLSIVHISVEMAPIAKVGGLGDVVTSLSRAVQDLGHNVDVILPKYDCLEYGQVNDLELKQDFHWGGTKIRVWNGKVEGITVHFLEPENGLFWAGCIYGRRDDAHRFEFFCHASLEFLLRTGRHPDIIHCHDWSSAPVAWLFQENYKLYGLTNAKIVFTIHNLEFGAAQISRAMANANMATTVSQTYAKEVAGNPAIAPHLTKFHGIRNGIDLDIWDPFDDPHIPVSYTSDNVVEGKKAAKRELQHRLGLRTVDDRPLVGIITRLTAQKGIHLIKHAIWRTLERSGQVVLLGSAPDPRVQNDFVNLSNQLNNSHGDMARLCLVYDEPLSHLIYAASDFILVPSIFEPCGLTQLTAMRFGAIPVVRRTGGLNDTVFDVDHDKSRAASQGLEPNGFSFDGTDAAGVDYALNRALSAWYEARDWFNALCSTVMEQDWSWNRPALDYVELYYGAKK